MAGWFPLFAAPSGFNGGRSNVNLNFLNFGGDFPFLDVSKNSTTWTEVSGSGPVDPTVLDTNGYPTAAGIAATTGAAGVAKSFPIPTQAQRSGRYAITWDGSGGTIAVSSPSLSGATGGLSSGGGPGGSNRYEFLPTSTADVTVQITATGSGAGQLTNLKCFHVDDETDILSGKYFHPKELARLREANFGVIRFLNWQFSYGTNMVGWSTRKPLGYHTWAGQEQRSSLYAGVTSGSAGAYTRTFTGFTLTHGAQAIVKFHATASGASTININSTGVKTILDRNSFPLTTLGNYPAINRYGCLTYNSVLDAYIMHGGYSGSDIYLDNGPPPEVMLQLCVEVRAHLWSVAPYMSCNPLSDYQRGFANLVRTSGPSWMKFLAEGPNELWNFGQSSVQLASAEATVYGWNYHDWMGKVMSVLGQDISAEFGADRTKYEVICGVQGAVGTTLLNCQASDERLKSAAYVAQVAAAQSGFTKDHAYNWVTAISPSNYFSPPANYKAAGAVSAYDYSVTNAANPSAQATNVSDYLDTISTGSSSDIYSIAYLRNTFVQWKAWAAGMATPVLKLIPYEGGYSPDYSSTDPIGGIAGITIGANAVFKIPECLVNGSYDLSGTPFATRGTAMTFVARGLNGTMGSTLNGTTITVSSVSGSNVTTTANTTGLAFATCTITLATPGVVHQVAHGYAFGDRGFFTTTGALPTGATANTPYWVRPIDADNFWISTSFGGQDALTGSQSGTHTFCRGLDINASNGGAHLVNGATYFNTLKLAGKGSASLQTYLTDLYNGCVSDGGTFPSCFVMTGTSPSNNVWSVLENIYVSSDPPQWSAIKAFNA